MSTRPFAVAAALLAGLASPVFAADDAPYTYATHGEASSVPHEFGPSTVSRDEVKHELDAWERNPVTASGWREVGGERGWVYEGSEGPRDPRQRNVAAPSGDGWAYIGG